MVSERVPVRSIPFLVYWTLNELGSRRVLAAFFPFLIHWALSNVLVWTDKYGTDAVLDLALSWQDDILRTFIVTSSNTR
jgi:uncharacterized membrane protein